MNSQHCAALAVAHHVDCLGKAELLDLPGTIYEVNPDFVCADVCRPNTPIRCGLAGVGGASDAAGMAPWNVPKEHWGAVLRYAARPLGVIREPTDCEMATSVYLSCDQLPDDQLIKLTFTMRDTPTEPPKVEVYCSSASLVSAEKVEAQHRKRTSPSTARPAADSRHRPLPTPRR